jgi:hypothetical protein
MTPAQTAEVQRRIEQASEKAVLTQAVLVQQCKARIAGATQMRDAPCASAPRWALMSLDVRPEAMEVLQSASNALKSLGWPCHTCIPDSPADCHDFARLKVVERFAPDVVLFVNGGAKSLAPMLPERISVACWHFPDSVFPVTFDKGVIRRIHVFAATRRSQQKCAAVPRGRGLTMQSCLQFMWEKMRNAAPSRLMDADANCEVTPIAW